MLHGHLASCDATTAMVLVLTDERALQTRASRAVQLVRAAGRIGMPVAALLGPAAAGAIPGELTPAGRIELTGAAGVSALTGGLLAGAIGVQLLARGLVAEAGVNLTGSAATTRSGPRPPRSRVPEPPAGAAGPAANPRPWVSSVPPPSVLRPQLRGPLRRFVEAAFASLEADVDAGHEVPFAVEERRGDDGPALYAYRPLFVRYVEERTVRLTGLGPYREAIDALLDDPGARTFAVARAGAGLGDEASVRSALLWPLVAEVAERADGFAFAEDAFDTAYGGLERAIVETRHRFEAVVPLVGVLVTEPPFDLGAGIQLRRADAGELATGWPDAAALVPERFGSEPDRRCTLELAAHLDREEVHATPDAARLTAAAVTALRLVSGGAIASGPVVFERVDLVPRAVRPMPPDVAVAPVGLVVRLDPQVAPRARPHASGLFSISA